MIVGGGVIGVEFATFFSSLNVKVTVVELADHILPNEDDDVADELKKAFARKGVEILEKSKVTGVEKIDGGYKAIVVGNDGNEKVYNVERVLVAVEEGRTYLKMCEVLALPSTGVLRLMHI